MQQKVLVIDDSIPMHGLIQAHLASDDLTLYSAYDGESGLIATANLLPNLILLDVDMPGVDGFEVCRKLKADRTTASIPVIFLTSHSMLADRVKGFELGAVDYVAKPFKPQELQARVRAALRTKKQLDATTMVDDLTGLWNRAYLDLHLKRFVSLAKRSGASLACIVLELKPFHVIGAKRADLAVSELMRGAGTILKAQCRMEDVICRVDEWKFVVLVPGSNQTSGLLLIERLRFQISNQLEPRLGQPARFTCIFGISDTDVSDESTLLHRAEVATVASHVAISYRVKTDRKRRTTSAVA